MSPREVVPLQKIIDRILLDTKTAMSQKVIQLEVDSSFTLEDEDETTVRVSIYL